jgi:hypothetical protein
MTLGQRLGALALRAVRPLVRKVTDRIPTQDRRRRWPAITGMACGLVCLAAAGIYALTPPAPPALPSEIGAVPGETATPVPLPTRRARPAAAPAPAPAEGATGGSLSRLQPARLVIPVLGVKASVATVGLTSDGSLGLPRSPSQVGWWDAGATPGDGLGSIILAGHVDDHILGRGALYDIGKLELGDLMWVDTAAGRRAYRVAARRVYRKAKLPGDVFARSVPERLVLITCTSPYDRAKRSYLANVVVYAAPTLA